ncbi:MAG: ROK family protein [Hyphomicrobium sp.]
MWPRIGVDLGGSKIEAVLLAQSGSEGPRQRIATPRNDYGATIEAIAGLVETLDAARDSGSGANAGARDCRTPVGVGIPGSLARATGLVQNANSTWLNGRPLGVDLAARLGRPVAVTNDANCFTLSEARDGAAAGARSVFGVILGTGVGGGWTLDGRLVDGPLGIAGEWGHNPLPWPRGGGPRGGGPRDGGPRDGGPLGCGSTGETEWPPPNPCWCGRSGCMESWVSGPALAADHLRVSGAAMSAEAIAAAAMTGDTAAQATLDRHVDRLARGLAHVVNIIDPDMIVLGGGLSRLGHLYDALPAKIATHIFADQPRITVVPPRWGDASGVRGAAWLAGV